MDPHLLPVKYIEEETVEHVLDIADAVIFFLLFQLLSTENIFQSWRWGWRLSVVLVHPFCDNLETENPKSQPFFFFNGVVHFWV